MQRINKKATGEGQKTNLLKLDIKKRIRERITMSNNLADHLTPEQIEQLKGLDIKTIEAHFTNPLYIQARNTWQQAQADQILKGAQKYPETFNPASWTNDQLFMHAVQENIDQMHYLVGMKQRIDEQQNKLDRIRALVDDCVDPVKAIGQIYDILEGLE